MPCHFQIKTRTQHLKPRCTLGSKLEKELCTEENSTWNPFERSGSKALNHETKYSLDHDFFACNFLYWHHETFLLEPWAMTEMKVCAVKILETKRTQKKLLKPSTPPLLGSLLRLLLQDFWCHVLKSACETSCFRGGWQLTWHDTEKGCVLHICTSLYRIHLYTFLQCAIQYE